MWVSSKGGANGPSCGLPVPPHGVIGGRSGERLLEPGLSRPARGALHAAARFVAELRVEPGRLEVVRVEHDERAAARAGFVLRRRQQSPAEPAATMRLRDPQKLDL